MVLEVGPVQDHSKSLCRTAVYLGVIRITRRA